MRRACVTNIAGKVSVAVVACLLRGGAEPRLLAIAHRVFVAPIAVPRGRIGLVAGTHILLVGVARRYVAGLYCSLRVLIEVRRACGPGRWRRRRRKRLLQLREAIVEEKVNELVRRWVANIQAPPVSSAFHPNKSVSVRRIFW